MEFKDYYRLLGLTKSATPPDIKKAYRKLARQYHPDVNPGDEASEKRFKEVNEAHEVLGDPEKRRKYDELGANWRQYDQAQAAGANPFAGGGFGFGGVGRGGHRTMSQDEVEDLFGDNPFSDFFQTFFAGNHPGTPHAAGPTRGRDSEHPLELSLDVAFHGSTQRLSIQSDGQTRSVEVRIPAGVSNDAVVRVAGEGQPGSGGAASGDLLLRVRITPHPRFTLRGRDLYVDVQVPVTTAILGGHVDVTTVGGKSVRLKIPEATQSGQVFRLKGKGMPKVGRSSKQGDLFAAAQIAIPKRLSQEARAHYEALAALGQKTTEQRKRTVA